MAAHLAAGFACARCGREDGPMRPASADNVQFVHTDPCTVHDSPVRAFTMQPKGRKGPARRPTTSLDALEHRADVLDERPDELDDLAERLTDGPVGSAVTSVERPSFEGRLAVLAAALDDAEANLARLNLVLAAADDEEDVDAWKKMKEKYVAAFDEMCDGGIGEGFLRRVARVDAAIGAMHDLLAGLEGR